MRATHRYAMAKFAAIALIVLTAPVWLALAGIALGAAAIAYSVIWVTTSLMKGASDGR